MAIQPNQEYTIDTTTAGVGLIGTDATSTFEPAGRPEYAGSENLELVGRKSSLDEEDEVEDDDEEDLDEDDDEDDLEDDEEEEDDIDEEDDIEDDDEEEDDLDEDDEEEEEDEDEE